MKIKQEIEQKPLILQHYELHQFGLYDINCNEWEKYEPFIDPDTHELRHDGGKIKRRPPQS